MKKLGMYLHLPFCVRKCYYCDFVSYEKREDRIEEYIGAVLAEIRYRKQQIEPNRELTTIYIGGGTPSILHTGEIAKIMETIQDCFPISKKVEITIEVNPGTVTKEKLESYFEKGINRLSIGLQSTKNELLKQIGRIHTYEEFEQTYQLARKIGFNNINIDLMLALPNQSMKMLQESIEEVISLHPEHISVYSLILEEATRLYEQYHKKQIQLPEEGLERKMYWKVKQELEKRGYQQYEISNFAKQGYESKHNLDCWEQEEYIGIGCAAHSYQNRKRVSNTSELEEYIEAVKKGQISKIQTIEEEQTIEIMQKEYMMLGLRKIEGVSISKFKTKFIQNPIYLYRKELDKLVKQGFIEIEEDKIRLSQKGLDFANLVWEEFV